MSPTKLALCISICVLIFSTFPQDGCKALSYRPFVRVACRHPGTKSCIWGNVFNHSGTDALIAVQR